MNEYTWCVNSALISNWQPLQKIILLQCLEPLNYFFAVWWMQYNKSSFHTDTSVEILDRILHFFSMWMCFMQIHSGDNGKFKWINNVHATKRVQVSGMNKLRSLLRGNQAFKALSAKQLNMKSRITFVFILFSLTSYLSLFSLYKLFFKAIKLLDFLCFTLRGKRSKQ